jgi:hypothetical protein
MDINIDNLITILGTGIFMLTAQLVVVIWGNKREEKNYKRTQKQKEYDDLGKFFEHVLYEIYSKNKEINEDVYSGSAWSKTEEKLSYFNLVTKKITIETGLYYSQTIKNMIIETEEKINIIIALINEKKLYMKIFRKDKKSYLNNQLKKLDTQYKLIESKFNTLLKKIKKEMQ